MLLDASSGSLLFSHTLVWRVGSARVWRTSPLHGDREIVDFPEGWLPASSTVTTGNNVDALLDADNDGEPDPSDPERHILDGRAFSDSQTFDFPAADLGSGLDPADFPAAAVANAFWGANESHDYFYALGFDEAAGNLQADNLGRGGEGGDALAVLVHRFDGAAIRVPPDGASPGMLLGLIPGPDDISFNSIDEALDIQTVIHEYAHAVTTRLVGGPDDVTCLNGFQSTALGEGWSDYFAISYTDDPVFAGYDNLDVNQGIRRFRYDEHPHDYSDLGVDGGFESHDDGEIWAAALWDLRSRLGSAVTDQLVMDALPLTPCEPSMAEARDAIVQAATLSNGGENPGAPIDLGQLWAAFARRGLGFSATGLDGDGVEEPLVFSAAFDTPPAPGQNQNPIAVEVFEDDAFAGELLSFPLPIEDPDGDALTYTVIAGPEGLMVTEAGMVKWTPSGIGNPLVRIEVTDSRGGRLTHTFSLSSFAELELGQTVTIEERSLGDSLAVIELPEGLEAVQFRVRQSERFEASSRLRVTGPGDEDGESAAAGEANQTLTFVRPAAGEWEVEVVVFGGTGVELSVVVPEVTEFDGAGLHGPFSGVVTSETFFSFTAPDGLESFVVSIGAGSGDVNLLLGRETPPTCRFTSDGEGVCSATQGAGEFGPLGVLIEVPEPVQALSDGSRERLVAPPGEYLLNLFANSEYEGVFILIQFDAGGGIPRIGADTALNGANFRDRIAAGSVATIFGTGLVGESASASAAEIPLPRELGGVRVMIDGQAAPLFFVSDTQINFQMPFETEPEFFIRRGSVWVEGDGRRTAFARYVTDERALAVFRYNRTPEVLDPVIVHADFSLVTPENPARRGETLVIFVNGLGFFDFAPATGEASPANPPVRVLQNFVPAITVTGLQSQVLFAGLTPGSVGLGQINFTLPEDLPTDQPTQELAFEFSDDPPVVLYVGEAP